MLKLINPDQFTVNMVNLSLRISDIERTFCISVSCYRFCRNSTLLKRKKIFFISFFYAKVCFWNRDRNQVVDDHQPKISWEGHNCSDNCVANLVRKVSNENSNKSWCKNSVNNVHKNPRGPWFIHFFHDKNKKRINDPFIVNLDIKSSIEIPSKSRSYPRVSINDTRELDSLLGVIGYQISSQSNYTYFSL